MNALLDRAIRGYETIIAIGTTLDAEHYAYYHNSATAGVFGAAVAALETHTNAEKYVHAMGLAGSVCGGLWQMRHEESDTKQWHIFHACATGISAALAADSGLRGPRFILEGPQGLYAATCKHPKAMIFSEHSEQHPNAPNAGESIRSASSHGELAAMRIRLSTPH